jgi:low affinity Fe/Cu permease
VKAVFRRVAARAPGVVGSQWTFFGALGATIAWIATGAFFDWSGGWVLWPATVTSVGAFLLVLLLQYTQNRDTRAVQLKLDELIRSLDQARTQLVRLEQLSDEELAEIEEEFQELRLEQSVEERPEDGVADSGNGNRAARSTSREVTDRRGEEDDESR